MNERFAPPEKTKIPLETDVTKKLYNKRQRLAITFSAAAILVIIAALFAMIIRLESKIGSLNDRLALSEEYIEAMNTHVYEYSDPDDVMLYHDNVYGEMWVAPLEGVPVNTLEWDNLELGDDNRYSYSLNGKTASKTGIDVSYHQGDIDWERVAADGIDFAMIRIGYRGYEEGVMHRDELADEYINGARAAGLDVGVYFYSQAVSEEEARQEAVFVCELIKDYEIKYPVVFDWELPENEDARTVGTTMSTLNKCAAAFCGMISENGYTAMIYSNLKMALSKYDMRSLCVYDFWYVEYKDGHNPPLYPYELQMWQYASDGSVDGIDGYVDMNISFVDYAAEYDARRKIGEE